jgi:polar amino acid transport system substrate-binding protein
MSVTHIAIEGAHMQRARSFAGTTPARAALLASALLASCLLSGAAAAQTIGRMQSTGKLTMGYFADAAPIAFKNEGGKPDGYAVAICEAIAADIKASLSLSSLATEFVLVGSDERFGAVREGRVDLLCGPSVPTVTRRAEVSFSIPILISGTTALVRADAPREFRDALEANPRKTPQWRGSPGIAALQERRFVVVTGTTTEQWAKNLRDVLKLNSTVSPVSDGTQGALDVREGRADALLGERTTLLNLASKHPDKLTVTHRLFDVQPLALALTRGDEDFRLAVDAALSRLYRSGEIYSIYERYLGAPDEKVREAFRIIALPQ